MKVSLILSLFFAFSAQAVALEKPLAIGEVLYTSPLGVLGRNADSVIQAAAAELCGGLDQLIKIRDLEIAVYSPKAEVVNGKVQVVYPKFKVTGIAVCK